MLTIEDRIKRAMVLTMLADGEIGDDEVATITREFFELTGFPVTGDQVRRDADEARSDGADVAGALVALGRSLDDDDRRKIVRAVHAVARSDGRVAAAEQGIIQQVGRALGMSEAELLEALGQQ